MMCFDVMKVLRLGWSMSVLITRVVLTISIVQFEDHSKQRFP